MKSMVPLPYKDFTIKARVSSLEEIEETLRSLKAAFIGIDFQTDHYFETENGKLKWREATIENLITHYERVSEGVIERTIVYRYDLNPSKTQIDELHQNHRLIGITRKQRKIYQIHNVKIHLDKLPNEEEFIEIEAIDRGNRFSVDELKNQCFEIKLKLDVLDSDLVPTGYFEK